MRDDARHGSEVSALQRRGSRMAQEVGGGFVRAALGKTAGYPVELVATGRGARLRRHKRHGALVLATPGSAKGLVLTRIRWPGWLPHLHPHLWRGRTKATCHPHMSHVAAGQNQRYHFGVGAPPILVHFSGDWDVRSGYGFLTHGHVSPFHFAPHAALVEHSRAAMPMLISETELRGQSRRKTHAREEYYFCPMGIRFSPKLVSHPRPHEAPKPRIENSCFC